MPDSLLSKQIHAEIFPEAAPIQSYYLRVPQAIMPYYPLKRAYLYDLISRGLVKSFVLKKKGAVRGLRLIDKASLDQFLQSAAEKALQEG